jgi:hypothetical protein
MWRKHMFDCSNTPVAVRAKDQRLIEAINDAQRRYGFSDAAAKELLEDFTPNPGPLRDWIFELCDRAPRAKLFVTSAHLAAFTREVLTSGQDYSARWADLTTKERRWARRFERYARDKRRVWMGAGRPQNVDRALVLYVIRRIEEATGLAFRFSHPAPLFCLGGPMLRLAEAALLRLFCIADNPYLGLVSPARYYTRPEIARTAKLARRASRSSPAKWQSDWILTFRGDVRSEFAGKRSSWSIAREALELGEMFEAAVASGRQTRLKYGSGLDVLQANLKSGAQPDLIELSKRKSPRDSSLVRQE